MSTKTVTKNKIDVVEAFGVRRKSNRAKLLNYLDRHKGKEVPVLDAIRSVYGSRDKSAKRKLTMVVSGLDAIIADKKLKLAIRINDGNIGLFSK